MMNSLTGGRDTEVKAPGPSQRDEVITVLVQQDGKYQVSLPKVMNPGLWMRVEASKKFIGQACKLFHEMGHEEISFCIQLHDEEPNPPSFLMDASATGNRDDQPMIPDFYCLNSGGYSMYRKRFTKLPPWQERIPVAVWRGSSTGAGELNERNFQELNRYKLCSLTNRMPGLLDARFNAIVQTESEREEVRIKTDLMKKDLLRPRMEPNLLALHRWIIDIDGNVNSWGLLWKLLSGSCILRVESKRCQWFYHKLKAWDTHVPIAQDLHDLPEKLEWCINHSAECIKIAKTGEEKARNVVESLKADQESAIRIYARKYL